ncbi:MAG TPA: rhodanese-like domain-containing protein [Burkholderiales bacterium]
MRDWLVRPAPPVVLDVREPWEVEICALPGSTCIPMAEIPGRIDELPRDRPIVVVCHHGMRSLQVARYLDARGFAPLYNLTGGIDAWARDVDPGVVRY